MQLQVLTQWKISCLSLAFVKGKEKKTEEEVAFFFSLRLRSQDVAAKASLCRANVTINITLADTVPCMVFTGLRLHIWVNC